MPVRKLLVAVSLLGILTACGGDGPPPTAADFEKMYNVTLKKPWEKANPVKVNSVNCSSAGNREWRCEVAYESFLNGPPGQLALSGYYESTISGIYGPRDDGQFSVLRDYNLRGQRRISPGR